MVTACATALDALMCNRYQIGYPYEICWQRWGIWIIALPSDGQWSYGQLVSRALWTWLAEEWSVYSCLLLHLLLLRSGLGQISVNDWTDSWVGLNWIRRSVEEYVEFFQLPERFWLSSSSSVVNTLECLEALSRSISADETCCAPHRQKTVDVLDVIPFDIIGVETPSFTCIDCFPPDKSFKASLCFTL